MQYPARPWLCRAALLGLSTALLLGPGCEGQAPSTGPQNPGQPPADPGVPVQLAPLATPHACQAQLTELAIYQAVKTPLLQRGEPVSRNAPIIEGRKSVFRAFLSLGGSSPGNARGRLTLNSATRAGYFDAAMMVTQDSTDSGYDTTLNFEVPGDYIQGDTQATLEIDVGSSCQGGGVTTYGPVGLEARYTGVLKMTIIPVRYEADGSGRMPDISEAQINRYRAAMMAVYPTREVELTVRPTVSSSVALTSGGGWSSLLEQIRQLRATDGVGTDVYYYAVVSPAASFQTYCKGACIAGLSFLVPDNQSAAGRQVGAGVGWEGTVSADTMVHEIGHQHGRPHAPCGGGDSPDRSFPDPYGGIRVWGMDVERKAMKSPNTVKDFMGYCTPQWISDYTFGQLANRRTSVTAAARVVDGGGSGTPDPTRYRSLLVDGDGSVAWGGMAGEMGVSAGRPERAQVLDADGRVITEVTVYRHDYGHGSGSSLEVPAPQPGWASLALPGHRTPIGFGRGRVIPPVHELDPSAGRQIPAFSR